ncbi:MAG: cadherin-like beta sandwich domain-containing protein [Actinomycetaceae bacterium]|nr:cadherin-like beta sandwich domain-containing protein [Actinomycetaceae bacterium]
MTRKRSLLAMAAGAAVAVSGFGVAPIAYAAPDPAPPLEPDTTNAVHPAAVWADSSAGDLEQGINGTTAALLDDDPTGDPAKATFWNTQWRPQEPYPHALAFDTAGHEKVCGISWTSRPSYKDPKNGEILGNQDVPKSYKLFALDEPVDMQQAWKGKWKAAVGTADFRKGDLVAEGGLEQTNDAQTITFAPKAAKQLVFVGLASHTGKPAMSASDLKVIPCAPPAQPATGSGDNTLVHDLYLNREAFSEKDDHRQIVRFDPATHTYYAKVYTYTSSVLPTVKAVEGAKVTINGAAATDKGDRQVSVKEGWNPITIKVTAGGKEATYVINVHKDSTRDFRDREVVTDVTAKMNDGSNGAVLFDKSQATAWTPEMTGKGCDAYKETDTWSEDAVGFELTFPEITHVSKLTGNATYKGTVSWDSGRAFAVWGSRDGKTFDIKLAEQATLRNNTIGGFFYWDFNQSAGVKALRVWMSPLKYREGDGCGINVSFKDLKVWRNANNKAEQLPEQPTGDTTGEMYNPDEDAKAWGISRANTLFMKHGVIAPTWVPSEYYGRGAPDAYEASIVGGGDFMPAFYDPPLFNTPLMKRMPNKPWALAKAPNGVNAMEGLNSPEPFLTDEMKPYAKNLVDIQFGDEGHWSEAERDKFKAWFDFTKKNYPQAIVHSNQNPGPWTNLNVMRNYARNAKPDVITWDSYEFTYGGLSRGQAPSTYVKGLMGRVLDVFRQVSMEGYDGKGADPIPWGQYIDYSFMSNFSASQKNLTAMLSLTAGAKWLGNFRMEYTAYDQSILTDANGTPTRAWYEYKDTMDAQRNLGTKLTALSHTYLATKPGDYGDGENGTWKGHEAGAFGDPKVANATREWGLIDVEARSAKNGMNAGRPGDVVIGYFKKIPGLADSKTAEVFGKGITDPRAFMVLNALAGKTSPNATGLQARYDDGAPWQTRQTITVTVAKPDNGQKLYRVDHKTGQVSEVELTPVAGGAAGDAGSRSVVFAAPADADKMSFDVTLDGGMADLFFWSAPVTLDEVEVTRDPNGTAYHPESIRVDSEQTSQRENAPASNLIDEVEGDDHEPDLTTFWHSRWDPTQDAMPHGIVAPTGVTADSKVRQVCGVRLAPRSTAPNDAPKNVSVYAFDKDPKDWPVAQPGKAWEGGKLIAEATTKPREDATILFDQPKWNPYIGVAVWDTHAGKPFTSLADFSLLDCTPELKVDPAEVTIKQGEDPSTALKATHAKPGQSLRFIVRDADGNPVDVNGNLSGKADDQGNLEGNVTNLAGLNDGEYTVILVDQSDTDGKHPLAEGKLTIHREDEPAPGGDTDKPAPGGDTQGSVNDQGNSADKSAAQPPAQGSAVAEKSAQLARTGVTSGLILALACALIATGATMRSRRRS